MAGENLCLATCLHKDIGSEFWTPVPSALTSLHGTCVRISGDTAPTPGPTRHKGPPVAGVVLDADCQLQGRVPGRGSVTWKTPETTMSCHGPQLDPQGTLGKPVCGWF